MMLPLSYEKCRALMLNILFDLDGTLIDSKKGITRSIQYSLRRLNRHVPSSNELEWCIGPSLRYIFSKLLDSSDIFLIDRAITYYRDRYSIKGKFENSVYPDIIKILEFLSEAGKKIFLATAKPAIYAHDILVNHYLIDFFNGVYGAELDGQRSDKGELIAFIMKSEGLNPGQSIMIGDSISDIIGGKQNNIATAGVCYGYEKRENLIGAGAEFIVQSPLEILKILKL